MHQVILYTRVGCHLCDVAKDVAVPVCADTGAEFREVDVDADPEDRAEYGDRVPVVVIDGVEHGYFEVDADRLRRALTG
ncbi:glutaredoxin family protein [Nakamurella flavida]|uniref:Glutaredoxin family protein n=1 Tax=Nakamurella flavida TaxID=363630 RepID=A0A938YIJ0_9ACTN|nr:glutaredoxin family protein [Nakamurella flavida]MBM9475749.1 glutaredoxin family protein [Nakamurella flavida]MDP9777971.1 glutaredoxin [Nakamurella flavida]